MGMFGDALEYIEHFDGHDAQRYFASHWWHPVVWVAAYLTMVRYLPRYMEHRPPLQLRAVSRAWNLAIALFSLCGACVCMPHLARTLAKHGFWYSTCADAYDLAGYGAPAVWASLFAWSKLLELFDTVLLVLKKRPVITLHWFHHSSVIIFAWVAWVYETPCALWYGAMNFSVHALMYSYFGLTSLPTLRRVTLRFAPVITALQISQFVMGTVVNVFAAVAYATPSIGCAIDPLILQLSALLYLVYGALFVRLFSMRYLRPSEARAADGPHDQSATLKAV